MLSPFVIIGIFYLANVSLAIYCPNSTYCDLDKGDPDTLRVHSLDLPDVLPAPLLSSIRTLYVSINSPASVIVNNSLCQLPSVEHLYWDGGGFIDWDNTSWGCVNGLRYIDLSHFVNTNHLDISMGLANVTSLSLTHNQIKSLSTTPFANSIHLEYIDLSSNQLESFPADVLTGLINIKAVNISHNNITTITLNQQLRHLQSLDVSHNNIDNLLFNSSQQLRVLNVSFNQIESLSSNTFHHVNGAEVIDLSFNRIEQVETAVFGCQLRSLKQLSLSGNQISTVVNHAFQGLVSLIALDLSHNILTQIPHNAFAIDESNSQIVQKCLNTSVSYSIKPMSKQSVKYNLFTENLSLLDKEKDSDKDRLFVVNGPWPMFQYLNLSHNKISRLPSDCFYQQLARVRNIDLSYNKLEHLPRDGLEHLLFLENINISHNKINWLDVGVFNNPKLKSINLSHNRLTKIISMAFLYLPALRSLDLSFNRINYIYKMAFYRTCKHGQQMSIDLRANRLRDDALLKIVNCFKHLQDTTCLLNVSLQENSFKHIFQQPTTSLQLNLHEDSARYFKTWDHMFFDINNNKISCDCRLYSDLTILNKMVKLFSLEFEHIHNLNFWHNVTCANPRKYTGITLADFKQYAQDTCKDQYGCPNRCNCILQSDHILVNCSHRHFQEPPNKLPSGPKVLHLQGNYFNSLTYLPEQYKDVESINLSYCSITSISIGAWKILSQIKSVSLAGNELSMLPVDVDTTPCLDELSISGNPISCDCTADNLVTWLFNCSDTLKDFDRIYCKDNTYLIDLFDRSCFLHDYSQFISSFVVTLTSMSATFLLILIIAFIIYLNRQRLSQCINGKQRWYKVHADDIVKCDVLILHCKSDTDTVMFGILPILQHGGQFSSICIQHRDWPSDHLLFNSVAEVMQKCHNVLIVASEQFVTHEMQNDRYATLINDLLADRNVSLCLVTLDDTLLGKSTCNHKTFAYNQDGFGAQLMSSLRITTPDHSMYNDNDGMTHILLDTEKY